MSKGKEGEICLGHEICPMHGIGPEPTGYHLGLVCLPKGRKATKKCVERDRKAVLILYSKTTFWKISEAICVRTDPSRDLASLAIIGRGTS